MRALVRIVKASLSGGYHNCRNDYTGAFEDLAFTTAKMRLEGTLIELYYGNVKGWIGRDKPTSVCVEIDFFDTQKIHYRTITEDKPYIGLLHLNDWWSEEEAKSYLVGTVRIQLPISMFDGLVLMKDSVIMFETIHDVIESPTVDQRADHIIAFVKRVNFETDIHYETVRKKKSFWVP